MVPEGARLGLQGMAAEMLPKTPIAIRNSHLFPRRLTCSLGLETSWKYGAMEFIDQLSLLFLAVTTVGEPMRKVVMKANSVYRGSLHPDKKLEG